MIESYHTGPLTEEWMLKIVDHAESSGKKVISYNKIKEHPHGKDGRWRYIYHWDNKELGRTYGKHYPGGEWVSPEEFFKKIRNRNKVILDRCS